MQAIEVLHPGLFSTFQDQGRLGYQDEGMPISGAMDQESMIIASQLVGRPSGPVLEMTYLGVKLKFLTPMTIAITGADMKPLINGKSVNMYQTLSVKKDDLLSFEGLQSGFRSYIAFSDDLTLEDKFASKSTYVKAGLGGYKGRPLQKGDIIEAEHRSFTGFHKANRPSRSNDIRVVIGYESDAFENIGHLFQSAYKLTNDVDRMGIRLEGQILSHKTSADIISSPIVPGAIQVPKNGQPIIMMRDAQTIGGYTRIGAVITCDLNKLAQMKPGDSFRFVEVSVEEAASIKKKWVSEMNSISLNDDRRNFKVKVNGVSYDVAVEEI